MATKRSAKAKADKPQTHEDQFWAWVQDVSAGGWLRAHPEIARALASWDAALVLSDAIHRSCMESLSPMGKGWFYMSVREWSKELAMKEGQIKKALWLICKPLKVREISFASAHAGGGEVRRARTNPLSLGLLASHVAKVSGPWPVSNYAVNWQALLKWFDEHVKLQPSMAAARRGGVGRQLGISFLEAGIAVTDWPGQLLDAAAPANDDAGAPEPPANDEAIEASPIFIELRAVLRHYEIDEPKRSEIATALAYWAGEMGETDWHHMVGRIIRCRQTCEAAERSGRIHNLHGFFVSKLEAMDRDYLATADEREAGRTYSNAVEMVKTIEDAFKKAREERRMKQVLERVR